MYPTFLTRSWPRRNTDTLLVSCCSVVPLTLGGIFSEGLVEVHEQVSPLVPVYLFQLEPQTSHGEFAVLGPIHLSSDGNIAIVA